MERRTSPEGFFEEPAMEPEPARTVRPLTHLMALRLPWWKRAIDIAVSSAALVVLSPVMLATAVAIRLSSPGPVFFKQMRAGLGGRPFAMYKFRSMRDGAERERDHLLPLNEQSGPVFKIGDDPRVTAVGRFIRRRSIDELPQLWNVLKGEMTLVGPRPLPVEESAATAPWQKRRLLSVPGLTCLWQVSGRAEIGFDEWARLDIRYQRKCSLLMDLWLLLRTPLAVLSGKGAC
jgi:lipopolysaccharide/colanic/teichoic acid biosynthesis glycosyltransferase